MTAKERKRKWRKHLASMTTSQIERELIERKLFKDQLEMCSEELMRRSFQSQYETTITSGEGMQVQTLEERQIS